MRASPPIPSPRSQRPGRVPAAAWGLGSPAAAGAATGLPGAAADPLSPAVVAAVCLGAALIALALWWPRRTRLELAACAALSLASLAWLVPAGPGWGAPAGTAWPYVLSGLWAWRMTAAPAPRLERALLAYAAAASLLMLPLWPGEPALWDTVQALLNLGAAGAVAVATAVLALRRPDRERVLLALLTGLGGAIALWAALAPGQAPAAVLPLLWVAAWVGLLLRRALIAQDELAHWRSRPPPPALPPSEDQLQQWRSAEREQAVLRERQRLMRDMHDGVGAALMSALVLVEQGRLQADGIAALLRECMDDIRLVIDSMEPVDHDLVALLASLRYRVGRRMELSGVQLSWQVDDVPALAWMDAGSALQILRIVQETLSNVLKHARASAVVLSTACVDDEERAWVRVRITDNGCGFDALRLAGDAPSGGRGLRNLRSRARLLHARLAIRSEPGCTEVTLDLPLHLRTAPERAPARGSTAYSV